MFFKNTRRQINHKVRHLCHNSKTITIFKYQLPSQKTMDKLVGYVHQCRKKGFGDAYIKKVLKEAGHQPYIINRALLKAGRRKTSSAFNPKPLLFVILGIAILASVTALFSLSDGVTGMATGEVQEILDDNEKLLELKNRIISKQIESINELDISVEEKQRLINIQTAQVNDLFKEIENERRENLEGAVELINSILARE